MILQNSTVTSESITPGPPWIWGTVGTSLWSTGTTLQHPYMASLGAIVGVWSVWMAWQVRWLGVKAAWVTLRTSQIEQETSTGQPSEQSLVHLVKRMLREGRCGLLLRPALAADLPREYVELARRKLMEDMALIPQGEVGLILGDLQNDCTHLPESEVHEVVTPVQTFFLDRFQVTNAQYQVFVDAHGYEQTALWDPEVLPAVLEFVDSSGQPGPRWWRDGHFLPGEDDRPVVGVSWYEAVAYSRWVGKRLPSDAEWVKAASWPVPVSASSRKQRRYPWGETMEQSRANVWDSGRGGLVAVNEYTTGASVSGAQQLVGNVWEWTSGDFNQSLVRARDLQNSSFKTLRGGAYDTYFEHQASCQYASGDNPLSRKHNVGFRCALGWNEIAASEEWVSDPPKTELQVTSREEQVPIEQPSIPLTETVDLSALPREHDLPHAEPSDCVLEIPMWSSTSSESEEWNSALPVGCHLDEP